MPLFTRACVLVATTAENRLEVHSEFTESLDEVFLLCDICIFVSADLNMYCLEGVVHYHRLIDHATVFVEECEHHVEVDERVWLKRKLLHDKVAFASKAPQMFGESVDPLLACSCTESAKNNIVACNLHVAAFNRARCLASVLLHRLDNLCVNDGRVFVYCVKNQRLPVSDICGHLAHHHIVIHSEGGVSHKEKVWDRGEDEAFLKVRVVVAFNKHPC